MDEGVGGKLEKEGIRVYLELIHVVQRKPVEHCKTAIPTNFFFNGKMRALGRSSQLQKSPPFTSAAFIAGNGVRGREKKLTRLDEWVSRFAPVPPAA